MKITLAQIAPTLNKAKNYERHVEIIEAHKSSDLIIFPELSLNGYMMMDGVYEDAYKLSELEPLVALSRDVDTLFGVALWEDGKIYNSALYCSKGEVAHIHYKNILPNYGMFEEARYFFKGNEILSFVSNHLKSVALICEDVWSSDTIDKVVKINPDIIYVISASPTRGFEEDKLLIDEQWSSILKTLALLSGAGLVYVNRVGFEDGMGFWGGSMSIAPDGKILKKGEMFKEDIYTIDFDSSLSKISKYMLRHNID